MCLMDFNAFQRLYKAEGCLEQKQGRRQFNHDDHA